MATRGGFSTPQTSQSNVLLPRFSAPTISGKVWGINPVGCTSNSRSCIVNGLARPCALSRYVWVWHTWMQRLSTYFRSTHVTVCRACCRQLLRFRPGLSVDKSTRDDRLGARVNLRRGYIIRQWGGMVSKVLFPFPSPFRDLRLIRKTGQQFSRLLNFISSEDILYHLGPYR